MKLIKDEIMSKTKTLPKDLAAIMLWRWERVNWTAVIAWTAGVILTAAIYVGIVMAAVALLSSCASTKEFHQQHTHTVDIDTLAAEAKTDSHTQQQVESIDSIVTASVWAAMQEFVKTEQEREKITETITTFIDSLGREVRQEQRTTDRSVSRQEQQHREEQLEQTISSLHQRLEVMDSEWHERLQRIEATVRDATVTHTDAVKQSAQPLGKGVDMAEGHPHRHRRRHPDCLLAQRGDGLQAHRSRRHQSRPWPRRRRHGWIVAKAKN